MYKKILVPLDGSELVECVLPHVETIIKGCNIPEVVFVSVVEPVYYQGDLGLTDKERQKFEANNKARLTEYLSKLVMRIKWENVRLSSEVIKGRADETLVDYVNKSGADLVVIATHGHSGISRWVFGSVAERMLRSVCIPVMMVRAPGCVPGI